MTIRFKAVLPHPVYPMRFPGCIAFWSKYIVFHKRKWTNVSTSKRQCNVENACVNRTCQCTLSVSSSFQFKDVICNPISFSQKEFFNSEEKAWQDLQRCHAKKQLETHLNKSFKTKVGFKKFEFVKKYTLIQGSQTSGQRGCMWPARVINAAREHQEKWLFIYFTYCNNR